MESDGLETIQSDKHSTQPTVDSLLSGIDPTLLEQFSVEDNSSDEEQQAYDDGDLPDFSADEAEVIPTASSSRGIPTFKKPPMKGKKAPLSKLKKKLTALVPNGNNAKKSQDVEVVEDTKGKGVKLSEAMLDKLMEQLIIEKGAEVASTVKREDLQRMVDVIGLNKRVLQGKEGLMGKGTKDVA